VERPQRFTDIGSRLRFYLHRRRIKLFLQWDPAMDPNTRDEEFDPKASKPSRIAASLSEWSQTHVEKLNEVDTAS
jgi:hypothetical protein